MHSFDIQHTYVREQFSLINQTNHKNLSQFAVALVCLCHDCSQLVDEKKTRKNCAKRYDLYVSTHSKIPYFRNCQHVCCVIVCVVVCTTHSHILSIFTNQIATHTRFMILINFMRASRICLAYIRCTRSSNILTHTCACARAFIRRHAMAINPSAGPQHRLRHRCAVAPLLSLSSLLEHILHTYATRTTQTTIHTHTQYCANEFQ